MRLVKAVLLSLSLLNLAACATVIEGSTSHINVATAPPSNASCTLTNARESVKAQASTSTHVKKSRTDLNVVCADPTTNSAGKTIVESSIEPWDIGSVLLGGIIGMGVDWATGAAYYYPDKVLVPLSTAVYPSASVYTPTPSALTTPVTTAEPAAVIYTPSAPAAMAAPAPAPVFVPQPVLSPPASDINATGGPYTVPPAPASAPLPMAR